MAEGDRMKCGDLREDYMECLHHSKEVPPPLPRTAARAEGGRPPSSRTRTLLAPASPARPARSVPSPPLL